MAVEVWVAKVLVLVALFVITFGFSLIPVKFMSVAKKTIDHTKQHRYQAALSFGSCFAAGVFLATCLLDLLSDVREKLEMAFNQFEIYTSFPFAEFVMVFGLFLILLIEQIVLFAKEQHQNEHEDEAKPLLQEETRSRRSSVGSVGSLYRSERTLSVGISDQPIFHHSHRSRPNTPILDHNSTEIDPSSAAVISDEHHGHNGHGHGHFHDEFSVHQDLSSHSVVRSILLLLALSFHSVFEGLAVGLQGTTDQVVQIFAALVIHKCILAFSLGINLVQSRLSFWSIIRSNLLFAITAPIGIGIGIFVLDMANDKSANMASGVLQGIACGTFLYITFFEVLPHEFNNDEHRLLKVLFLVLGFSVMVVVMLLNPEHPVPGPHINP